MHPDLGDNLAVCACKRAGADYLAANDRQLIANADAAAKTPEQMLPCWDFARDRRLVPCCGHSRSPDCTPRRDEVPESNLEL
ncbi:MAG TPA: hypothetical protein PK071_01825 [Atopobiaceae bacterium]|nr:hypothetical protein [Atopobiaceae bacterium]